MTDIDDPTPDWAHCLGSIKDVELRGALWRLFEWAGTVIAAHQGAKPALVVLVSRRMTCLYDMFFGSGFPGFTGAEVLSDRALDASSVDLASRTIVLIDDAFILGSTLADLYDELVDRDDPPVVTTMVACVDRERYAPALLKHVGIELDGPRAPCLRDTKELEAFAFDVASCLYRAGVPYFSDFPIVQKLEIAVPALDALLRGDRWYVADVSALEAFGGPDRRAYSLIPRDETAETIRRRLAGRIGELAELLKIRLYVEEGEVEAKIRVVPIGIPGAMMAGRLDRELAAVEEAFVNIEPGRGWRDWKEVAKHRLLQMYISTAVLTEFWIDLEQETKHVLTGEILEPSNVRLYFGEHDAPAILAAFDAAVVAYRTAAPDKVIVEQPKLMPRTGLGTRLPVRRSLVSNALLIGATCDLRDKLDVLRDAVPPSAPKPGEIRRIDRFWAHRALEVFGLVDRDLERPQEAALRDYDYESYRKYRATDGDEQIGPRVIKQGITAAEVTRLLLPDLLVKDEWSRVITSLAIDIGNDLGVVVPSTRCGRPDGPVFRQYRSGETAYLVNRHHNWLHRRRNREMLDLFTQHVIDEELGGDADPFFAETDRIIEVGSGGGEVVQVWDGTVQDVNDKKFSLQVQSRLTADVGSAALDVDLLGDADRPKLGRRARVEWVIVQTHDELGRAHRTATVRVRHPATP